MQAVNQEVIQMMASNSLKPENAALRESASLYVPVGYSMDFYEGMLVACEVIAGILKRNLDRPTNEMCLIGLSGVIAERHQEAFPVEIDTEK